MWLGVGQELFYIWSTFLRRITEKKKLQKLLTESNFNFMNQQLRFNQTERILANQVETSLRLIIFFGMNVKKPSYHIKLVLFLLVLINFIINLFIFILFDQRIFGQANKRPSEKKVIIDVNGENARLW
jgi:hypothetical protein